MAQRLTSMLPSDYMEDNLDAESKILVESLAESATSRTSTDETNLANGSSRVAFPQAEAARILKMQWEDDSSSISSTSRGDGLR